MTKLYLAGPMSGIPQFNFPLFIQAAEHCREQEFDVVSPAELDREGDEFDFDANFHSPDGVLDSLSPKTWGFYLSRDVKIVADEVEGIIFLPEWETSKGARLEAYVALACGHTEFYHYEPRTGLVKTYPIDRVRRHVRASV